MALVGARAHDTTRVPARLCRIEPLRRSEATRVRTFRFQLGLNMRWTINGHAFDPDVDLARPRLGDVEVWRFMSDVHHSVHVHLVQFQVLRRDGAPSATGDGCWKDTVDLIPGQTCEVIARFAGYRGRYVMHCHNLEHEDMAMMAMFSIV